MLLVALAHKVSLSAHPVIASKAFSAAKQSYHEAACSFRLSKLSVFASSHTNAVALPGRLEPFHSSPGKRQSPKTRSTVPATRAHLTKRGVSGRNRYPNIFRHSACCVQLSSLPKHQLQRTARAWKAAATRAPRCGPHGGQRTTGNAATMLHSDLATKHIQQKQPALL